MKKKSLVIFIIMLLIMGNLSARVNETVQLPDPQRTGGMPLFEALNNRQSARSYSPQKLTMQQLSNLLWAAYGVNRDDGRRTAPSARNVQEFDIYLIMEDGWYVYDHTDHALIRLGDEDLREHAGSQEFVSMAPLNLIFVADYDRMAGYSPENSDFVEF